MENKSGKLSQWWGSLMDQTKRLLLVSPVICAIYVYYSGEAFFSNTQYGIAMRTARFLGEFVGTIILPLIISLILGLFGYLAFHTVAEKYKRYLDYFAIVFLVITAISIYSLATQ